MNSKTAHSQLYFFQVNCAARSGLFIDDDEISNVSCAPLILLVLTYYILSPCKIVNPLFLKFICLVDLSCFSSVVLGAKYIRLNECNLG